MPNGYGQFSLNGRAAYAHRVSYEMAKGLIPKGMQIMHSCDNRGCVNPAHLSLGTFDQNMADMTNKRRQAHGEKNGHAKLTAAQVLEVRNAIGTQQAIADAYGVCRPLVSMIRSRRIWRNI